MFTSIKKETEKGKRRLLRIEKIKGFMRNGEKNF